MNPIPLALVLMMAAAPCGALAVAPRDDKARAVPNGVWGGDHAILQVIDSGAELELDCARGRIAETLVLDADGHFDLPGTIGGEGHGPARDDAASEQSVRYQGHVEGDTMTLAIVPSGDRGKTEFTLTRGREPILRKCR